ncbi:MAG: LPP20 family lipoprotein [Porticoccaceae bacterium]
MTTIFTKQFSGGLNRISTVMVASLLSLLVSGCATTSDQYNDAMIENIINKQENIMATGYAVISVQPHDNPAQQRLLSIRASKLDAYRSLMEQVYGQYLDANTTVAEMVVESDAFKARVQGVIYGAELESISPVGDDTYETTLTLDREIVDDLRVLYLEALAHGKGA